MANITLTGQLLNGLNEPIVGEYVYIRVTGAGTDENNSVVYPRKTFTLGPTDSNGDLPQDDIWVNGDSGVQSYYEVLMPGGERINVVVPSAAGGTTIDLSDFLSNSYRVTASAQSGATDNLNAIAGLATTDGNIIVGDGTTWVAESGATARTSLGFGDATDGGFLVGNGTSWVTETGSTLRASLGVTLQNAIFVAKNGSDTRTGLDPHDIGNPFLTCTAALAAASSGDTIIVFPGSYLFESALAGADGVDWIFLQGVATPAFNVSGAFSFNIHGAITDGFTVSNSSANIKVFGNNQVAASLGPFTVSAGEVTFQNIIFNASGIGATNTFDISGSSDLTFKNCKFTNPTSGATIINIANSWSGSFIAKNCDFIATTVATNEATTGILYGTSVTGSVQLKDCTIITAEDGTGTAKSIDAPSAQTVYVHGDLNVTHDIDSDITLSGGDINIDTNFTV